VGDVDQHAQPVHLLDGLAAESAEPAMVLHLGFLRVAGRIAELVGVRPGQRHVPDAQPVEVAQHPQISLQRVPSFQTHQHGQLAALLGGDHFGRGPRQGQLARMSLDLEEDCIDQIQCSPRGTRSMEIRIDPDAEELGAEAASARLGQVDHLLAGLREVRSQVEQVLRRVGVAVDDEQRGCEDERVHPSILRLDRVTSPPAVT
jgi:hypothetical protein